MNFELITLESNFTKASDFVKASTDKSTNRSIDNQSTLASNIAEQLGKPLHYAHVTRFADGETEVTFENTSFWQNKHVIIIQSTYPHPQEQILHVAFLAHELKNAECATITAIIPYFGYSRQEKSYIIDKFGPAQIIAQLLQNAGIDRIITLEAHTPILKNFFTIPFYSLSLIDAITQHIKQHIDLSHGVSLIAVDKSAYNRAYTIAHQLDCDTIQFTKERYAHDKTKIISMSGEPNTHTAILVDDIIDTGGTALHVCDELAKKGVEHIFGYFVHPVLSDDAVNNIQTSAFEKVFVSNTIPLKDLQGHHKIEQFDISPIIVEQIKQLYTEN